MSWLSDIIHIRKLLHRLSFVLTAHQNSLNSHYEFIGVLIQASEISPKQKKEMLQLLDIRMKQYSEPFAMLDAIEQEERLLGKPLLRRKWWK